MQRAHIIALTFFGYWLLAFISLTIASYEIYNTHTMGNMYGDGWRMEWGYPGWFGYIGSDYESIPSELATEGQVALLHGFVPANGKWYINVFDLLLAITVPFAPIALIIAGYRFIQNRCRYYLSTLLVFVLICAILMGLNIPKISEIWPSYDFWPNVGYCCILVWPSISATITLCFLFSVGHEWWRRRIDAKAKTKKPQVDGDKT
jgi:hypothetical protein